MNPEKPRTTKLKKWLSLSQERADLALKEKGFDGIISRKINRKISAPVARLLYNLNKNIDPNYLTFITGAIGIGTGFIFILSKGNPLYAIWGGILTQISSIADGVDGDYARYLPETLRKETEKSFGAYLDAVIDRIVDLTIIYGMGVYLMNVFPNSSWILPLVFATVSFYLLRGYVRHRIIKTYSKHKDMKYYISSKINLTERDITLLILSLGGVLEVLSYVIPLVKGIPLTLSMAIVFLLHFYYFINSFFEMKRNLNNIEN